MAHRIKSQYFWKMCMTYLRRFSVKWYSSAIPFLVDFQKVLLKPGIWQVLLFLKWWNRSGFVSITLGTWLHQLIYPLNQLTVKSATISNFFTINILLIYWIDPPKSPEEDLPNFRILVSSKLSNSSQRKITHGFAQNTSL